MVASSNGDYGFLDLGQAAFDLSDRGVEGRSAPRGPDAYLFAERGVYRSGETVFVTALLRDAKGAAIVGLPLTLVARRPDGVEYRRALVEDQGVGGRAFSLPLLRGRHARNVARHGLCRPEERGGRRDELPGRGLRPRTARDQPDPEDARLAPRPAGGDRCRSPLSLRRPRREPRGLRRGRGRGGGDVGDQRPSTASPSGLRTRRSKPRPPRSRRAARPTRKAASPCRCRSPSLRPPGRRRRGSSCGSASLADARSSAASRCRSFRKGRCSVFARISGTTSPRARPPPSTSFSPPRTARVWPKAGVVWSLYKVERRYQWFNQEGRWGFEPVESTRRVADGTIDLAADAPARIAAAVNWGSYRLDVAAPGLERAQTSVSFTVGWSGDQTADVPDLLDMALDKASYRPGESDRGAAFSSLRRTGDARRGQRQGPRHPGRRRGGGRHQRIHPRERRLGPRRLPRRHGASSARPGRPAHAGALARRDLVRDRPRGPDIDRGRECAGADAAARRPHAPRPGDGACPGRGSARHGRGRRCRHPQPDPLRGPRSGRVFLRAKAARDRNPRPLRLPDRRHAGHARRHPLRRRCGRRHRRQPAGAGAPGALFRRGDGRP